MNPLLLLGIAAVSLVVWANRPIRRPKVRYTLRRPPSQTPFSVN